MYLIKDQDYDRLTKLIRETKQKIRERRGQEAYYDMNKINDVLLNAKHTN